LLLIVLVGYFWFCKTLIESIIASTVGGVYKAKSTTYYEHCEKLVSSAIKTLHL